MNPNQTAPLGPCCLQYRLPKNFSRQGADESYFYLAGPEVDVKGDKLAVFLHKILQCVLFQEIMSFLFKMETETHNLHTVKPVSSSHSKIDIKKP